VLYAFSRFNEKDEIIVILNNSGSQIKQQTLNPDHKEYYKHLFSTGIIPVENGRLEVVVPAKSGVLLKKDWYK
jgi:hypothetical protein